MEKSLSNITGLDEPALKLLLQVYEIADRVAIDKFADPVMSCERICHLISQFALDRGAYLTYDAATDSYRWGGTQ